MTAQPGRRDELTGTRDGDRDHLPRKTEADED
jgi:hypothetical protein